MATILQLLQALNRGELPNLPAPARPLPLGPLQPPNVPTPYFEAEPALPPGAPLPALDLNLINQFAGAAPARPVLDEPNALDKVAAILGGIGYGPQYGMALREERERPMREYNAALERYQGRRAQGVEMAERKRERQQEQATRRAEAQAEREFNVWLKKTGVTDQMAVEQLRQAFDIQKLREAERIADEKLQKQQEQQNKIELGRLSSKYRSLGAKELATELAQKDLDPNFKLSPRAEKWYSARVALDEARADRLSRMGAGGGGDGRLMAALENGQIVPASLVDRDRGVVIIGGKPVKVVNYVGGGAAGTPQQPAPQVPTGVEGFGLIPGIETAAPPSATREQLRRYARENKISLKQAQEDFKKAGVTMR